MQSSKNVTMCSKLSPSEWTYTRTLLLGDQTGYTRLCKNKINSYNSGFINLKNKLLFCIVFQTLTCSNYYKVIKMLLWIFSIQVRVLVRRAVVFDG